MPNIKNSSCVCCFKQPIIIKKPNTESHSIFQLIFSLVNGLTLFDMEGDDPPKCF